jgi:hypothetical protein
MTDDEAESSRLRLIAALFDTHAFLETVAKPNLARKQLP